MTIGVAPLSTPLYPPPPAAGPDDAPPPPPTRTVSVEIELTSRSPCTNPPPPPSGPFVDPPPAPHALIVMVVPAKLPGFVQVVPVVAEV
jgi:hypothetical protein